METKDELLKKVIEENKKLKQELIDTKEQYEWYYNAFHKLQTGSK